MSISETSGRDPKPLTPSSDPPESDNLAGTLADIPPDPLLKAGSFIDINISNGETLAQSDNVQGDVERDTGPNHQTTEPPHVRQSSDGCGAPDFVANDSNCAEVASPVPVPENTVPLVDSRPRRGRRKKSDKIGSELAVVSAETPDWLPSGWFVEDRVRSSGASAGLIDKYYVEPVSGHRFRSKKEVLHFLQTGTRRKRKSMENPDFDITSLGSSGVHKQKRSGSRIKSFAYNFNFVNVPEKINWVLTDSSEGSWTPFIGDEKVPESIKQEWAAAFASLTDRNTGGGMF